MHPANSERYVHTFRDLSNFSGTINVTYRYLAGIPLPRKSKYSYRGDGTFVKLIQSHNSVENVKGHKCVTWSHSVMSQSYIIKCKCSRK